MSTSEGADGTVPATSPVFTRAPRSILCVLGTRPEAIKLAPLILALRRDPEFHVSVCATGQHRELLDRALADFAIAPDFDLDIMRAAQSPSDVASAVLAGMPKVFAAATPQLVVVQGDTTSAFSAALAAYHCHLPVAHLEAGLRADGPGAPWPEEGNRRMISAIAGLHFAPTAHARDRLLAEGVSPAAVHLTGNTVIDALRATVARLADDDHRARVTQPFGFLSSRKRLIVATLHRRESIGAGVDLMCGALADIANGRDDCEIVLPVHPNPAIEGPVRARLGGTPNIHLVAPLDYLAFVALLQRAYLIVTDSGGIQEEAAWLGKPTLVMRGATERPEGIDAGTLKLVGTSRESIVGEALTLLDDPRAYDQMAVAGTTYGDGTAVERIVAVLRAL